MTQFCIVNKRQPKRLLWRLDLVGGYDEGMGPELETLDQLQGGEQPLRVIRRIYADDQSFAKSIHALLLGGDVRLLAGDEVPSWRWRELFIDGVWKHQQDLMLDLTPAGAKRIG